MILEQKVGAIDCPLIKLTQGMIDEVDRFDSSEQLLRSGGISIETLDRAAHGFSEEDIKEIDPKDLKIKWKDDLSNVVWEQEQSGLSKSAWARKINISEPIDVSFENNKFYIEDGHHRYYAAKILGKKLNINLEIKMNPIIKIAPSLSYDDFHRCVFDQVKALKK